MDKRSTKMRKYVITCYFFLSRKCYLILFVGICDGIQTSNFLQAKCYKDESVVSCTKPFSGTRAKLTCAPLYEDTSLAQFPYRYCKDGTWDRNLPNCVPGKEY